MYKNKINIKTCLLALALLLMPGMVLNINTTDAALAFKIKGSTLVSYKGKNISVTIPEEVKKIGKKAFAGNKAVKKVIIKEGVSSIQTEAFSGCTKLKNIKIPASVTKISPDVFKGCNNVVIKSTKNSYALEFAKKHRISYKITKNKEDKKVSLYNITGIECYWYTAGVFPCIAQKKTVTDSTTYDSIYKLLLSLNSGTEFTKDDIMINGGQTLRIIIHFSDKDDLQIECNCVAYIENGVSYHINSSMAPEMFWEQVKEKTTEAEL